MYEIHLNDEGSQMAFGAYLAQQLGERPLLVFLQGDLGAGKTTLVRGFLQGKGYQGTVRSPTYTLVEPYEWLDYQVFHLDLYRLSDPEELEFLGAREIFAAPHQVFVEWPERGEGYLPMPDLSIYIQFCEKGRCLRLEGHSALGKNLEKSLSFF